MFLYLVFFLSFIFWLGFLFSPTISLSLQVNFSEKRILNIIALTLTAFVFSPYVSSTYISLYMQDNTEYSKSVYSAIYFLQSEHPKILTDVNLVYADQNITLESLDNYNPEVKNYLNKTFSDSINILKNNLTQEEYKTLMKDIQKKYKTELKIYQNILFFLFSALLLFPLIIVIPTIPKFFISGFLIYYISLTF